MANSIKFVAGGNVQAGDGTYISRKADQELFNLCVKGTYAYILTPRQIGKSSLMIQTAEALKKQSIRPVTVDLTQMGTQDTADRWYLGLITVISRGLGLSPIQVMRWWKSNEPLETTLRFTQFFEEVILNSISEQIVIFIDEIDTTLKLDFTDDFFAAVRYFYQVRAKVAAFKRLSFVLIGVATPSDLIADPERTPFNIGRLVELTDFTYEEAMPFANGFGLPISLSQNILRWILKWTGGHPYLTQRLCEELVNEKKLNWSEKEIDNLVEALFLGEKSGQDNNLQFVQSMLLKRTPDIAKVLTVYRDIRAGRRQISDEEQSLIKSHLKLSGLVIRKIIENGFVLRVRNQIYAEVFNLQWINRNLPIDKKIFRSEIQRNQDNYSFVAGGSVQSGGGFYLPRQADQELLLLCRSGTFGYILTPRQMGKTSLLVNTADHLAEAGIRPVMVDLTKLGTQLDSETWHLSLLTEISRYLELVRQLLPWWKAHQHLGATQKFTQFFEEVILLEISDKIVIFIDEIDTTLNLNFADDFFAAIRFFYMARAENPEFEKVSFVLVGVASPNDLIRDPRRTPFNIGKRIDLTDFTLDEALPLTNGFNLPAVESQKLLQWAMNWTGGHPYLTQRLCGALAQENHSSWSEFAVTEVVNRVFLGAASKQDSNLQFVQAMLTSHSPDVTAGLTIYNQLLREKPIPDEDQSLIKSHLKLSGVVKRRVADGVLEVRNPIYRDVFNQDWVREHLPINRTKQLQRAALVSGIIFLVGTAPLGAFAAYQWRVAVDYSKQLKVALEEAEAAREAAEQAQWENHVDSRNITAVSSISSGNGLSAIGNASGRIGLWNRAGNLLETFVAHEESVTSVSFSPDGTHIASGSSDGTVKLWTLDGNLVEAFEGHEGSIISVNFSPVRVQGLGYLIASGSDDGKVKLWRTVDGVLLQTFEEQNKVYGMRFSPDGTYIASISEDGTVKSWHTAVP